MMLRLLAVHIAFAAFRCNKQCQCLEFGGALSVSNRISWIFWDQSEDWPMHLGALEEYTNPALPWHAMHPSFHSFPKNKVSPCPCPLLVSLTIGVARSPSFPIRELAIDRAFDPWAHRPGPSPATSPPFALRIPPAKRKTSSSSSSSSSSSPPPSSSSPFLPLLPLLPLISPVPLIPLLLPLLLPLLPPIPLLPLLPLTSVIPLILICLLFLMILLLILLLLLLRMSRNPRIAMLPGNKPQIPLIQPSLSVSHASTCAPNAWRYDPIQVVWVLTVPFSSARREPKAMGKKSTADCSCIYILYHIYIYIYYIIYLYYFLLEIIHTSFQTSRGQKKGAGYQTQGRCASVALPGQGRPPPSC